MIAKLTGILDTIGSDHVILDVNGVGYMVLASARTLAQLPAQGQRLSLHTETILRNEQPHLVGFASVAEQQAFRLLLTVQGVGAKVALAIQAVLTADELARAIAFQDKASIGRADGVGPKLASRIVSELKDKVGEMPSNVVHNATVTTLNSAMSEAISALQNLGYRRPEAIEATARASHEVGPQAGVDVLIRSALKHLSKSAAVGHD